VAAIVVLAQLLVVSHTVLVAHTLSASGAVVERAAKSDAAHDHEATSWCKEGADRHVVADALCGLAKNSQAARGWLKGLRCEERVGVVARLPEQLRVSRSAISVLRVAPKASPPMVS